MPSFLIEESVNAKDIIEYGETELGGRSDIPHDGRFLANFDYQYVTDEQGPSSSELEARIEIYELTGEARDPIIVMPLDVTFTAADLVSLSNGNLFVSCFASGDLYFTIFDPTDT